MPAHLRLVELRSTDFGRTASFYARLCDWQLTVRPDGSAAEQPDGPVELRWVKPERIQAAGALPVVEVTDLPERLAAVEAGGGRVLVAATPIAGGGTAALISDPDGNVLALQAVTGGAPARPAVPATGAAGAPPSPRRTPAPKKARPTGAGKPKRKTK